MTNLLWKPQNVEKTRMWDFIQVVNQQQNLSLNDYQSLYQWSINNPDLFWSEVGDYFQIQFTTPPKQVLNDHEHMMDAKWFEGASFNYAEQLLQGIPESTAIISIAEDGQRKALSYKTLKQQVLSFAAGLKSMGVNQGDRVVAYMPNNAETIIAFLATASIGAIWSSCSPDFGLLAAVDRLGQVSPKILIMSASHSYNGKSFDHNDKITEFQKTIPSLEAIVLSGHDLDINQQTLNQPVIAFNDLLKEPPLQEFISVPFNHPLYILFSSGTTGQPKCIVHGAGGSLLQHMKELGLHTDISSKDNLLFFTTCGWMMWNWMVSVLSLGATLTVYDGAPTYPTQQRLFDIIADEHVTVFGTSAKYLSTIEKAHIEPATLTDLTHLRCILSTGSPLLPKNYDFVYEHIKPDIQLSSISGGTDIVSCFALGNPMLPVYRGELQCLGLGMAVEVYNEQGESVVEQHGELVCTKAFPSMPVSFWNDKNNQKYMSSYFNKFEGVWAHGDFAEITPHQGLIIHGRSDAVLNPGGVRIGTAEIYRQVEKISEVVDSVVIGQQWHEDVRVILFVKLAKNHILDDSLKEKIKQLIRKNASPRHVPAKIIAVDDIPRTISNKVVELAVRDVIHNKKVQNINSLANPEALEQYKNISELQDS